MQKWLVVGVVCVTVAALAVVVQASRQSDLDPADGQRLLDKLAEISGGEAAAGETDQPVIIHQREINAYLRFHAGPELPAGVTDPHVALRNRGAVAVRATVDLSALRDARPRGSFDPLRYLNGRLPVAADGVVRTQGGMAHVDVASVTISGVPMPTSVFTELVRYYSRSEQYPDGIDVTKPFDLPSGMSELRVEHERVVVVH